MKKAPLSGGAVLRFELMQESDELRWELGEAVMNDSRFVPGGFIFVYGAVIGWKWCARAARRGWRKMKPAPLLRLPPPLKALPPPRSEASQVADR